MDDFESVGIINGVPAHEFNLDNLEDKPWRKPGADITGKRISFFLENSLINLPTTEIESIY